MLSFRFVQTHITDRSLLSEVMAAVLGSSANRGLPRDPLYSVVKVRRENLSPHFISEIFWGIRNLGIPLFTKCLHFVAHEEILSTLLLDIFCSSYERFFDIFSFLLFYISIWNTPLSCGSIMAGCVLMTIIKFFIDIGVKKQKNSRT